jgi:phage shock protein A
VRDLNEELRRAQYYVRKAQDQHDRWFADGDMKLARWAMARKAEFEGRARLLEAEIRQAVDQKEASA